MPVRFTCRLLVIRTESGNVRLRYGYLGDDSERILTLHGPTMFLPPEEEMTDAELDRVISSTGFSTSFGTIALDAPLVEAKKTMEDEIPPGSVRAELFWTEHAGSQTLGVKVKNESDILIRRFSLATICRYEAAQPETSGGIEVRSLGGTESMFHRTGLIQSKDLVPNMILTFVLDPMVMPVLRSRVASVSSDSHWIAMATDGYEFDRIPGDIVAAFVESADH